MIKAAINRIIEIAQPEKIDVKPGEYTTKPVSVVKNKIPDGIVMSSLLGLIDYINDGDAPVDVMLHIASPTEVNLYARANYQTGQRPLLAKAVAPKAVFPFGAFIDIEAFIINVQAGMVDTDAKRELLALVGNIKSDTSITVADDGVTQQVGARTGVALAKNVKLPNPFELQPYRSFHDVVQPKSRFILRVKNESNQGIKAALIDADGGAWQTEAVEIIFNFLASNVSVPIFR